jgi:glutaminase
MELQDVLNRIQAELADAGGVGAVADYIPELATVAPDSFGMAVVTVGGGVSRFGDADRLFSIQSISKVFALAMALQSEGDALWRRVGREPSGHAFNSLVQLENERGIPRNPFINAGALVVTDVLCSRFAVPENAVVDFLRCMTGRDDLLYNRRVARSERETGHRNAALAHFMKSFGNLMNPVDQVLDAYCRQCAIEMSCVDLARAAAVLAGRGVSAQSGARLLGGDVVRQLNAVMHTCGTYDGAGDFAVRVGLPAKSGVGGGILAVVPGQCGLCVWSPRVDASGNSVLGVRALERFVALSGHSVF